MRLVPFETWHTVDFMGVAAPRPYGPAWTAVDEHGVVAVGGVNIQDDIGEAWFMVREDNVPAAQLHVTVLSKLHDIVVQYKLNHLHAFARKEWGKAKDWLERLGFEETTADEVYQYYERK